MTDREDAQEYFDRRYENAKKKRDKKDKSTREYQKRMKNKL